jgi:hypothetical protein
MEGYEAAQVCLNGHPINQFTQTQPKHNQEFCGKCGSPTITHCSHCKSIVRGYYHSPGLVDLCPYTPPAFCYQCGNPYPWTEKRLAAARHLVSEAEKLHEDERRILTNSLDDLIRETPNTPTAVLRFKKLAAKAGASAAEGLRSLLVDVLSEAVRKQIWPT